jgi:protein-S-isoprenylcysteine O-methyltransferase Ste14
VIEVITRPGRAANGGFRGILRGMSASSARTAPRWLASPWVDRVVAVVAVAPFAHQLLGAARAGRIGVVELTVVVNYTLLVLAMVFRTPPVRVTRNPFYWALAFVATYWGFLTVLLYEPGTRLAPEWIADAISLLSLTISAYARVSLGRSIGFVPAERAIVKTGAYAFVRHPIYSGLFLSLFGLQLSASSWRNLALDTIAIGLFVVKTLVEERFLAESPDYATYMRAVRWRWFPGLA